MYSPLILKFADSYQWRDELKLSSLQNETSLDIIEAASFLVCLDECRPDTPSQRAIQFMYGDGSNRWNDKSLQFVICENGVSGFVCEHSQIDALTMAPLLDFVTEAILAYQVEAYVDLHQESTKYAINLEQITFDLSAQLESRILHVRTAFQAQIPRYSYAGFDITSLSPAFLRKHKIPPRSGIQVALQLAFRRFCGYSPCTFETASLAHFSKGRVDNNYVLRPEIKEFCDAMVAATSHTVSESTGDSSAAIKHAQPQLLPFLRSALRTHAKFLMRASSGHGIYLHLRALEWMLRDDELGMKPPLFTDPIYERAMPHKVMTDSMDFNVLEAGMVYPWPDTFWLHFEVKEDR